MNKIRIQVHTAIEPPGEMHEKTIDEAVTASFFSARLVGVVVNIVGGKCVCLRGSGLQLAEATGSAPMQFIMCKFLRTSPVPRNSDPATKGLPAEHAGEWMLRHVPHTIRLRERDAMRRHGDSIWRRSSRVGDGTVVCRTPLGSVRRFRLRADLRGSITPSPVPAHGTGQADLPHRGSPQTRLSPKLWMLQPGLSTTPTQPIRRGFHVAPIHARILLMLPLDTMGPIARTEA